MHEALKLLNFKVCLKVAMCKPLKVSFPFLIICILILLVACQDEKKPPDGEQLAKIYCGSCHAFPEATLLDKGAWQKQVLPAMSTKMGLRLFFDEYYEDKKSKEDQLSITLDDWKKIVDYYQQHAPESMPPQGRPVISAITNRFESRSPQLPSKVFPSSTFVKIDPGNHWIYSANALDSSIVIFNQQLQPISRFTSSGVIVDMEFESNLSIPGERKGIMTNIGIINPTESATGTGLSFLISRNGRLIKSENIISNLPRPVQISITDLDNDKSTDYLVCGFGNQQGRMIWLKKTDSTHLQSISVLADPGATKAIIEDVNNDGLPEIWALFAQAKERIYLFTNKSNGQFEQSTILEFPPVYGSTYFEFADFNKDGYKDILYTCGDNADLTSNKFKNYHGLYIFLNDGKNHFSKEYFFPINGCYKAIARDFDLDGDLDIVSISYFPDYENQPQEGFVYLENSGDLQFKPYTINGAGAGKWITMDAEDADGDGDQDVVIGSLAHEADVKVSGNKKMVLFLFLENKTK